MITFMNFITDFVCLYLWLGLSKILLLNFIRFDCQCFYYVLKQKSRQQNIKFRAAILKIDYIGKTEGQKLLFKPEFFSFLRIKHSTILA